MTNLRIGHGYDVHRLVEGRPLILGGVTVPYEKSKPQRTTILFAFTFLGAVAGMGCVLLVTAVAEIVGSERMKRFVKELPAKSDVE